MPWTSFLYHYPILWYLSPLLQVLMIIHYFRRRPESWWFYVIIFLGPLGALAYFVMEVLPDLHYKPPAIARFERRRRRRWLEPVVEESPTPANQQELAELLAADGDHQRAIDLFTRVLARDPAAPDLLFGRAKSYLALGDTGRAIADLERLVCVQPNFHFYEGYVTLAETYVRAGREEVARAAYQEIVSRTTVSRAYFGYGELLNRLGEREEARRMMRQILAKRPSLPRYLKRQERPWFRKAEGFLKVNS